MAPHSSTLAWKIPWTEEPGGLPSMGSQRVGHDWSDLAAAAAAAAKMGEKSWDCWDPGGGQVNQAPGLTIFQVLQDKINSITWNQSCDFLSDWWWYQFAFCDYKQESQTAISSTEWISYLGSFPSWDSRCSMSWDLLALFQSGCWSKSNLVMYTLLFLFLFSFNVSILKVS